MYGLDYDGISHSGSNISPLMLHIKAYEIADKRDVPSLLTHARERFDKAVKAWCNGGTDSDIDDLSSAITQVYQTSSPPAYTALRDIIANAMIEHKCIEDLLKRKEFPPLFVALPEFAVHLTGLLARRLSAISAYYRYI